MMRDINEIVKALNDSEKALFSLRAELESEIAALNEKYQPRINALDQECKAFRLVAEKLGLLETALENALDAVRLVPSASEGESIESVTPTSQKHPHHFQRYVITIGDAIEKALCEAENPMSIDELLKEITKFGVTPGRPSLRSAIVKNQHRFERVSDGVIKLRQLSGNAQNFDLSTAASVREKVQDSLFSLTDAVKDVIPKLPDTEFTVQDVLDELIQKHPDNVNKERRGSISAILSVMFGKNKIGRVQEGRGGTPSIYKVL